MQHIGAIAKTLVAHSDEREDHCETHGAYTAKKYMGRIWSKCPVCSADDAKQRADRVVAEQAEAERKRIERMLGAAGIPERFANRKLGSFDAVLAEQRYALDFAERFADEFAQKHSGRCAVFAGMPGTGKTHLACGIALRIMNKYHRTAVFTTVSKMARRIREAKSFSAEETESAVIAAYVMPHLLIVDEVGMQSGTDAEARSLFDVVNERYEACKPTLFLTNLDLPGVRLALGERLFDRMREDGGEVVAFNWDSYRGVA